MSDVVPLLQPQPLPLPLRVARLWLLVVFVAFAVLAALTHPSLYGYVCKGGALCYAESLFAPRSIADLPQLFHFVTTLAQLSALGWLLAGVARRQRARRERGIAGLPARRSLSESLAHIVFALSAVTARLAFSADFGLADDPRFLHVAAMLLSGTSAFFVACGFFFEGTGLDASQEVASDEVASQGNASATGLRWVPLAPWALSTAVAVALSSCVFAFLQYDAGVFPCGPERTFCLDTGRSPAVSFLAANALLPALATVLSLAAFALGALRVKRQGSYEAFFLPWAALAWLALYVGRRSLSPVFPSFAMHQISAWLLALLLIGLALRHTPR